MYFVKSPLHYFSGMEDFRIDRTKAHLLEDIIVISILSVLCGADTWDDMEDFGKSKESWLRTFLKLPGGIPSHDTFNRIFSLLDPKVLEECFIQWTNSVACLTEGEVISIDGKTLCGSRDKNKKSVVHMVSAWAGVNNIVLGQLKVDDKSNEITAIPELLEVLVLKGCVVTIDATGCQRDIASAIASQEADYILALKGNQGNLLEQTGDSFRFSDVASVSEEIDTGHGRVEQRVCTVVNALSMIEQKEQWKGLQCLVRIEAERYFKATGKSERKTRYYNRQFARRCLHS